MKKQIIASMLTVAALFCSCSKQDDLSQTLGNDQQQVTFTLSAADVQTRATSAITLNRYVMEVYTDASCTTAATNVFKGETSNRKVQTTPTFELLLNSKKNYYCLFWADNVAEEVYNVTSLKAVTLKTGADPKEAFYAMLAVTQAQANHSVTLKRAVAKVTLNETEKIKENSSLKTTYARSITFNVATATAAGATNVDITTPITDAVSGTAAAPVQLAAFYTFVSAAGGNVDFSFTLNSEPEKAVTNVPLKTNFVTNIKGEFSGLTSKTLEATASDDWNEMDIEVDATTLTTDDLKTKLTTTTAKRWTINGTLTSDGGSIAATVAEALLLVYSADNTARISVTLSYVTNIGANEFEYLLSLAAIYLPKVTKIGDSAFGSCSNLKTLTFGSVITSWGADVFSVKSDANRIDLTLHKDQIGITGNIWKMYTWKSISYVDDNGNPFIKP